MDDQHSQMQQKLKEELLGKQKEQQASFSESAFRYEIVIEQLQEAIKTHETEREDWQAEKENQQSDNIDNGHIQKQLKIAKGQVYNIIKTFIFLLKYLLQKCIFSIGAAGHGGAIGAASQSNYS